MGLFHRKPKLQDEALIDLAQMFLSLPDDPTPGTESLNVSRLDFSVDSLAFVDDFLDTVRLKKLEDADLGKLVLRCGAYVGEVIRRNAIGKTYHWLDYDEALRINKMIANFGKSLGTAAVLWDGSDGIIFPLAKVGKFLENGREDSVLMLTKVMIEKAK